jgi:large subunit ribosomal protein L22
MPTHTAVHRHARISAQKVRRLADLVRGKFVDEAIDILRYQPHRGARLLEKVILSAAANAQDPDQNEGVSANVRDLYVAQALIEGGPMFKRIQPRSRGQAFMIKKRTSHIRVSVSELGKEDVKD